MIVYLERWADSPDGMFGTLKVGNLELSTVERPWKNNKPSESAIPPGKYPLKLGRYNKGGYAAYELVMPADSPRDLIKIHKANTMDQLLGCIGVGIGRGYMSPKAGLPKRWAVTDSGEAFKKFMQAMDGVKEATLVITVRDSLKIEA